MKVTFEVDGKIRFIYEDEGASLMQEVGPLEVKRASHVEPKSGPYGTWWHADMSPVGGPSLGPFSTRAEALEAERDWLIAEGIPKPR
jgi:hypothetical protein